MNKTFLKKALTLVGAAILALPLALSANTVQADTTGTQNVIVTKYGFKSDEDEAASNEVGLDEPGQAHDGNAPKLAGAEFTVYNVTTAYWQYVKDNGLTGQDQDTLSTTINAAASQLRDGAKLAADPQTTDANGQATFADLPQYTDGQPSVYVFAETKTPEGYQADKDFVVSLPYGDGQQDVKVFPKNLFDENAKLSLKFKKVDANATKTTLADAEFYITRTGADGKLYAKVANANDQTTLQDVEWVAQADATTFKTGADGLFGFTAYTESTVNGALHGLTQKSGVSYTVEEVTAPEGYNKDAQINGKDATTVENHAAKGADVVIPVTDTPEGILPHTGGAGIVAFVVLGAALLVLGGVAYNKRRANF
ncbi:pilin N-terminal domain-containing protein [Lacticaseibacillus absianus]|uniref:pilin N-terminal domain-containing protein n=1 Tax=Lacticaseibacillus absianus TaxID=2729623 RepID=UPI0015C8A70C|nr:pilin N-terminal domain-containing protein [Lacticaseibacillus absianus]